MNDTVDASSKHQHSLPISSDAIMQRLNSWGIAYTRADHVPLRTVEESKKVQGQLLSSEQGGGHIKNLYLRDNKKRNVLLVAEQDRQINLKTLNTMSHQDRSTLGRNIRVIENLELVKSAVGKDKREVRIEITELGKKKFKSAYLIWERINKKITIFLGKEKQSQLIEIIKDINNLYDTEKLT